MKNNNHEVHITFGEYVYFHSPSKYAMGVRIEMNRDEYESPYLLFAAPEYGPVRYTLTCLDCEASTELVEMYDGAMVRQFTDSNQKLTKMEATARADEPICIHWKVIGKTLKKQTIRVKDLSLSHIGMIFYTRESGWPNCEYDAFTITEIKGSDKLVEVIGHDTENNTRRHVSFYADSGRLITISPQPPKKLSIEIDEDDLKRIKLWFMRWDDHVYSEMDPEDKKAAQVLGID